MIDKKDKLPLTRQCNLLDLNRSGIYYTPVPLSVKEMEIMRQIDGIHLTYPFYGSRKIRNELWAKGYDPGRDRVRRLMRRMGVEALYVKPRLSVAHPGHVKYPCYLDLLHHPSHGFGKHFNPCIDCKILMLARAREIRSDMGADFLVIGEVMGQRPMSQRRNSMRQIERESGCEGLLLRPLSARLLPETEAEAGLIEGDYWISMAEDAPGRLPWPGISELSISRPLLAAVSLLTPTSVRGLPRSIREIS